ncbi:hypothetical protein AM228_01505 [Planktothricoides sp. SR001]|nr:hypothetical protein AM228_01505 [Planktothricoides sp. SR001]
MRESVFLSSDREILCLEISFKFLINLGKLWDNIPATPATTGQWQLTEKRGCNIFISQETHE